MKKIIVLVNTSPSYMENVLQDMNKIAGVEEAYMVYGVYDIFAIIHAKTSQILRQVVLNIREIDHINDVTSMNVVA